MPIGKKTIARMAQLSKLTVKQIEDAIAAETEMEIDIPDTLTVLTSEELTQRDSNADATNKSKWIAEGEKQGKELVAKTLKEKLGLTTGTKDIDAVVAEAQTKLTGETALQDQIKLLQTEVANKDKEVKRIERQLESTARERQTLGMLPAGKNPHMSNEEHLAFVNTNIKDNGDGTFSYKGQVMRDEATKNALPLEKVIEHMYNDRKSVLMAPENPGGAPAGRGAGDQGGGGGTAGTKGLKNIGEARRSWQNANPDRADQWGNEDSQMYLRQVMKDNPEFVSEDDGQ